MSDDCLYIKGNTSLWDSYFCRVVHSYFYTVYVALEILKVHTDVSVQFLLLLILLSVMMKLQWHGLPL